MTPLLAPFMSLAAVGFALSIATHLAAWAGYEPPGIARGLHYGIFLVCLPAVLVVHRLTRDYPQRLLWKVAFRGAPRWLRSGIKWLSCYAILNFVVFLLFLPKHGPAPEISFFRGFSGHWMIFYGGASAIFYSALHADERDRRRRCLNGDAVSAVARYCEKCGAPLSDTGRRS